MNRADAPRASVWGCSASPGGVGEPMEAEPSSFRRQRVLLVEDDRMDRMAVVRSLRGSPWEVVEAATLAQARAALQKLTFACAILDQHLPDGDGASLLPELVERGVATVVLSGGPLPDGGADIMGAGAQGFITKDELQGRGLGRALRHAWERARLVRKLERRNRDLHTFTRSVAHDLRAPARHLVGVTDMMLEAHERGDIEEFHELAALIRQAAVSLDRTLDGLHQHLVAGSRDPSLEPVDLRALAQEVTSERQGSDRVRISGQAILASDPSLLITVLRNLIGNALKYSDGPVHVQLSVDEGLGGRIEVRDRGPGIPDSEKQRIFEPFRRLHAGEVSGTGLGLSITHRIVEVLGGRITIHDADGGGAIFRVMLPVAAEAS